MKKVNLSWNGFGPEGGVALADAIHTNGALLELDVSGNRLDCNSAVLIAKALKNNDSLQILRVSLEVCEVLFITTLPLIFRLIHDKSVARTTTYYEYLW